jgi:hypothetical protein
MAQHASASSYNRPRLRNTLLVARARCAASALVALLTKRHGVLEASAAIQHAASWPFLLAEKLTAPLRWQGNSRLNLPTCAACWNESRASAFAGLSLIPTALSLSKIELSCIVGS